MKKCLPVQKIRGAVRISYGVSTIPSGILYTRSALFLLQSLRYSNSYVQQKIQWSRFRWVLPYLRGHLSFDSEQKHFSTLVLPSCRLKQICELLPACCTVWLVVAGVKLLSHTADGFCQPKGLNTKSHWQKTICYWSGIVAGWSPSKPFEDPV